MAGRGVAKTMWTYILQSLKTNKYYIGQTKNLDKRIIEHNQGLSKYTKSGIPWKIIYKKEHKSRTEAVKFEKLIKSYKGGNAFKKLINLI